MVTAYHDAVIQPVFGGHPLNSAQQGQDRAGRLRKRQDE
jgi:hypothetical protein